MATPRNTVNAEAGKGIEALRSETECIQALAGAGTTLICLGPWPVDIDVITAIATPADAIATNAGNTLDLFNGTVAANKPIITQLVNANLFGQLQIPQNGVVLTANQRVKAGTPITARLVTGAANANLPSVTIRVGFDIPLADPNAKTTTYSAYDSGMR